MTMDTKIASVAPAASFGSLAISAVSLGLSIHFWRKSFRPIVTAVAKTHSAGSELIAYDFVVLNSGSLLAKSIRISAK